MRKLTTLIILALLTVISARGEGADSLQVLLQRGDSCMQRYDTFEALKHYQRALVMVQNHGPVPLILRLADCYYKRGNYRETADLAKQLMQPDTTVMKAITLSQGEGYYLTQHYPEAVAAWKEHLAYNPSSIATYYNIANAYAYLLKDEEQALSYYRQFLSLAEQEPANEQLGEMIEKSRAFILYTTLIRLCCRSFSFNAMSASVGAPMRSLIPIRS